MRPRSCSSAERGGDARDGLRAGGRPAARGRAARSRSPDPGQLLLRVEACGVCRTDLHLLDGEVEIAAAAAHPRASDRRHRDRASSRGRGRGRAHGRGAAAGRACRGWAGPAANASTARAGARTCARARASPAATSTAAMAEYAVADERFCFPIPESFTSVQAAPLLCAGLIGYRALRMCGEARRLGLYGFGAAAHILTQVAVWQGRRVYAFTRPGDEAGAGVRARAGRELGRRLRRSRRPSRSRPRSSSLPTARSCRLRCARSPPAARSCAAGST